MNSLKTRLKTYLRRCGSPALIDVLENCATAARKTQSAIATVWGRAVKTPINLCRHENRENRRLEIGPGGSGIPGFETLDVVGGRDVDYVSDASKQLPFADSTFRVVYASHVLEHIPWYQIDQVLEEWVRILRSGGRLEAWVPNGLKIC